jgi:hypothetical protein
MLVWGPEGLTLKGNLPANYPTANKASFDAARKDVMQEETLNAAETLKDWMSGD